MNQRISSTEREMNFRLLSAEERSIARNEMVLARLETFAVKVGARFEAIERMVDFDKTEILDALQTDRLIKSLEQRVFAGSPSAEVEAVMGRLAPRPRNVRGLSSGAVGTLRGFSGVTTPIPSLISTTCDCGQQVF